MMTDIAPPVRVIAIITLLCSTLDVFADIVMSIKLSTLVKDFNAPDSIRATYCYFLFTAISVIIYIIEVIDIIITLKNNQENRILTPLVKSLIIVFEEVPLPVCLLIIYSNEATVTLANPMLVISCIKLVTLTWGILKFMKIKFCWLCLPCLLDHGMRENVRRCFSVSFHKFAMIVVNICHAIAITVCLMNIIISSRKADNIGQV